MCLALAGRESHALAEAPSPCGPDRGAGVHTDGAQLYVDSAWWTLLMLLQPVLPRCSAGHFLFMRGCYDISVAGSGVCREARGGACAWYAEGYMVDGRRHETPVGVRAASQCTDATNQQKCEASSCNVLIGKNTYCSKCSTTSEAPVNGVCTATTNTACEGSVTTGLCTQCKSGYFLHKGGCYQIEGTPGSVICKTAGNAGICQDCQAGYFKNPANVATSDSCIACGDTKGVQVGSGPTYKGVDGCTACTAESLKSTEAGTAKCTACNSGKKPNAAGDHCYTCPDEGATAGCSSCSADNTCEACVSGKILKTSGSTKTCAAEAECTAGFFVSTASDVKTCASCTDNSNGVPDCATCEARADDKAKAKCLSCTGAKKPKVDGTQCNECDSPGCTNFDTASQCAVCGDGYRHDANTCQKCTPEHCKACANDAKICTTCSEGYTLEGGKCVPLNTNKSSLSTGAIAGILVAVIVVVGGLVGSNRDAGTHIPGIADRERQ